jgi:flagellar hook-associated protein 3 FlgL
VKSGFSGLSTTPSALYSLPGVQEAARLVPAGSGTNRAGNAVPADQLQRVEQMEQPADDRAISLKAPLSDLEDIDLPQTILELQLQQVAYQAALGATQHVITTSLADFLR